ncbi:MAG: hypothetical protein RR271_07460, partial [Oscillospiraceae bacterium]
FAYSFFSSTAVLKDTAFCYTVRNALPQGKLCKNDFLFVNALWSLQNNRIYNHIIIHSQNMCNGYLFTLFVGNDIITTSGYYTARGAIARQLFCTLLCRGGALLRQMANHLARGAITHAVYSPLKRKS